MKVLGHHLKEIRFILIHLHFLEECSGIREKVIIKNCLLINLTYEPIQIRGV